jgi:hypothetical protein
VCVCVSDGGVSGSLSAIDTKVSNKEKEIVLGFEADIWKGGDATFLALLSES